MHCHKPPGALCYVLVHVLEFWINGFFISISANYVENFYRWDTQEHQNQRAILQVNDNLNNQIEESDENRILLALVIVFSTMWGLITKEWKGSSRRTMRFIFLGIMVLIFSTVVMAYSSSLATPGQLRLISGSILFYLFHYLIDLLCIFFCIHKVKYIPGQLVLVKLVHKLILCSIDQDRNATGIFFQFIENIKCRGSTSFIEQMESL